MTKEELLKGLTDEQIAKVKACKNQEELLALEKKEGVELSEEQLEAVNGGAICSTPTYTCPVCGSTKADVRETRNSICVTRHYTCKSCGHKWENI